MLHLLDPAHRQDRADSLLLEARPVPDPVQPHLFERSDQLSIDEQCGAGVTAEGVQSEDVSQVVCSLKVLDSVRACYKSLVRADNPARLTQRTQMNSDRQSTPRSGRA